jgi:Domain of unknown function (DUF4129)
MRILRISALCLSLVLLLPAPAEPALFGRSFSLPEYVAELSHLQDLANQSLERRDAAREAMDDCRGDWKVDTQGQTFTVANDWLIAKFEDLAKNPTSQTRDEVLARLAAMLADAQAFQQSPPDSADAHRKLSDILSRSEFNRVHGPTWWDRLEYRILKWISHLLDRFFGSSSAPTVGRVFVWTLVGLAVLALAWFTYRTLRQNARLETLMPEVLPVSAKQWRVWLQEARAAADKGLWRDAVHLAYWGGISFLEENGMWRPDKARTPREYLRLLPEQSEHRTTLSQLTRRLETTWYGNEIAGPDTFSETLTHLENLGCR